MARSVLGSMGWIILLMGCATQESNVVALDRRLVEERLSKAGMDCCEMKRVSEIPSETLQADADTFLAQVKSATDIRSTACKHVHSGSEAFGTFVAIRTGKSEFDVYFKPMHLEGLVSAGVCETVF